MSILVIAEHDGNNLKVATRQTIAAAAQLGNDIHVLIAGDYLDNVVAQASKLEGVSKVLVAQAEHLAHALAEDAAALIVSVAASYSAILGGHSSFTRDILPRAAAQLDVGMVSDVVEIISPNSFKRPIYAGNLIATVDSEERIRVLTVRGSRFKSVDAIAGHAAEIKSLPVPVSSGKAKWVAETKGNSGRPELSTARVVVSGGRSLGSEEKFQHILNPLAETLGAAIGASRAAVDAGYAPNDTQVGQTGTLVAPDIYMAFGISGSIQHTAGIKDSKVIVAVNLDPDAPIFQVADYGLVADLFEVIPQLNNALVTEA
ncbi:electron transfer flavoprotein alpha subunit [Novimethylophilus kurashikiensis]|uniref:Electron transfer flavoprotein subunit alpha n=1 Tax=Novimethylophilus kurashikiensis TaxID=1825523 RepID=A0A2R5FEC6_9PROT|nr:FAD-binding protein [Novimethylophilus kurashikiensis]GBG16029.1 electron transfer flavoprotein alpha subunit [Novimethylophilus kurashikiensis]